ncbi:MAG: hypothetical protein R6U26_03610 [Candidatus Undinarchaeales archaeon]
MTLLEPAMSMEIALLILVGLVLMKYSGLLKKVMRGVSFLLVGIFFLFLDVVTGYGFWAMDSLTKAAEYLGMIWQVIAWIMFLLAAVFVAIDVLMTS